MQKKIKHFKGTVRSARSKQLGKEKTRLPERGQVELRQWVQSLLSPCQLGGIMRQHGGRQHTKQKAQTYDLIMALIHHMLQPLGALEDAVEAWTGKAITGAAVSKRRQRLPWKIFERIVAIALRPLADVKRHPAAFYQGLRLVGVDGTLLALSNTPSVLKRMRKVMTRRFHAAFAHLHSCLLVELGMHNPLGLVLGRKSESELSLAARLFAAIPPHSLVLADRLFGNGRFLAALLESLLKHHSDFLVRVKSTAQVRRVKKLGDGSWLVELRGRDEEGRRVDFLAREIYGVVKAPGRRRAHVRLWTSLLEWQKYPSLELLTLYGRRWEQELCFKELKVDLRRGPLLLSQTPETAMQEAAAMVIAHSLLARMRMEAGHLADTEPLRISYAQTLYHVRCLWGVLDMAGAAITPQLETLLTESMLASLARRVTPKRRNRSCPRGLRQPVSSWPRVLRNYSFRGKTRYAVTRKHNSKG